MDLLKKRSELSAVFLVLVIFFTQAARAQTVPTDPRPTIDWRVEDRFRLFSEASEEAKGRVDTLLERIRLAGPGTSLRQRHQDYLDALAGHRDDSLRTSHYDAAAPDRQGGSGRYHRTYLYPESYRIIIRGDDPRLSAARCRWVTLVDMAEGPCREGRLLRVGPGHRAGDGWVVSATVRLVVDGGPEHAYEISFPDTLIVALGDSYISGEGNPDVPSVITDEPLPVFEHASWGANLPRHTRDFQRAAWWDEPCHRSLLSWPVLASLAYAAPRLREAVTLVHLGCSGATIGDMIDRGETELPGGGDEPAGNPQLAQLDRLIEAAPVGSEQRTPDRILLSVGGNDSRFVGVLATIVLPPGGYWVPILGPWLVGREADATCPYIDSGPQLRRLCPSNDSAQDRLDRRLPDAYDRLAGRLSRRGWANVRQFSYPNPISGERGLPCNVRSAPNPQSLADMGGFEALMGRLKRLVRGFNYSWDFELQFFPEQHIENDRRLFPGVECDWEAEPRDSEICQGLWVYARLNQRVAENDVRPGWRVVSSHLNTIAGHGVCVRSPAFEVALPRVENRHWVEGWTPQSYRPYDAANERWFRTPNDSIVTQYGDPKHFHHGSFHPTFTAHLAYAQAALDEALER